MELNTQLLIYQTNAGDFKIDVRLEQETVWLSQGQMSNLFWKDKRTISEHIQNVVTEGKLDQNSVVRNFRTTACPRRKGHLETTPRYHLLSPQTQRPLWN